MRLRIALEVDSVSLTKQLVKAGAGYSILTYIAIKEEIARGELVAHRMGRPGIRSSVAITTLRENPPSRFAAAWTALLQDKLKEFMCVGIVEGRCGLAEGRCSLSTPEAHG
ncbi:LysR substrate-binding domain-containing protein [Cupriavidus basilensis]